VVGERVVGAAGREGLGSPLGLRGLIIG
jgi:hypothetical protein